DLRSGQISVLLTTPEFLVLHAKKIAEAASIGFIAFDEAHHMAVDTGFRPAYQELSTIRSIFPDVQILAATATADSKQSVEIEQLLNLDKRVIDTARRPNLTVVDSRDRGSRLDQAVRIVSEDKPSVIYTYSRDSARFLVRDLRKALPHMAMKISFYHAGLDRSLREQLEQDFADGTISCLVTTSAFGEGVNIRNIRNLILYYPPFSRESLNQLAGRAGRDGEPAVIHMLFNLSDSAKNRELLERSMPNYDQMAFLYRYLKSLDANVIEITFSDESIALALAKQIGEEAPDASQISIALDVFAELDLIQIINERDSRLIKLHPNQQSVDLNSSSRYREAYDEIARFDAFIEWLTVASVADLEHLIQGAILPDGEADCYE
ncbi:MAG: hypothetical protein FWD45_06175, partial [Coriobacteriia bacterium]|nr:hypothetical protein [Coriobacteriia bacterium]